MAQQSIMVNVKGKGKDPFLVLSHTKGNGGEEQNDKGRGESASSLHFYLLVCFF